VIRRAADRFYAVRDGVETWHSFSAGAHYDPDNVAHGSLVAVDDHVIAAGAGFDWHSHRGVAIVSWVVSGRLRHEDDAGRVRRVGHGEVLVQRTANGIRHCEVNASAREPLRLVQMTLLDKADRPSVVIQSVPLELDGARFDVWRSGVTLDAKRWYAHVTEGDWRRGPEQLGVGDSVRGSGRLDMSGAGELLVWTLP